MFRNRPLLVFSGLLVAVFCVQTVQANPLKFPDQANSDQSNNRQEVRPVQGEGRFLNINKVPNGLFNRLTYSNNIQDDIGDYDDQVGGTNSDITEPSPTIQDTEDRRRHGHRRRPCVPYTPFRNNPSGRAQTDDNGQGRTFFNLFFNDYNIYGGGGGHGGALSPQYDTYGGYPCYSLGGSQNHRPQRPHRPGGGALSDDPGAANRPPFWGPGGVIDLNMILSNWLRPGSAGSNGLSDSTGGSTGSTDVKPIVEINVQDTVQDVVSTAGGFLGAVQGLFSQTPPLQSPLADPVTPAAAPALSDEPERDPLIQPRPSKRPHRHHHRPHHHHHHHSQQHTSIQHTNRHRAYNPYSPVSGVTQIAGGITNAISGFPITQATAPQTFGVNNRRSVPQNSNASNNGANGNGLAAPWWSFYGLFN